MSRTLSAAPKGELATELSRKSWWAALQVIARPSLARPNPAFRSRRRVGWQPWTAQRRTRRRRSMSGSRLRIASTIAEPMCGQRLRLTLSAAPPNSQIADGPYKSVGNNVAPGSICLQNVWYKWSSDTTVARLPTKSAPATRAMRATHPTRASRPRAAGNTSGP